MNGENIPYSTPDPSIKSGILFTVGSQTYTAVPEGFILGSTPISAGGPAATIFGQVISIGTQGAVIGGESIPFSTLTPCTHTSSPVAQATRSAKTVGILDVHCRSYPRLFHIWPDFDSGRQYYHIRDSNNINTICYSAHCWFYYGEPRPNDRTALPYNRLTDRLRAQRASISLQARL